MNMTYKDEEGKTKNPLMGCYGIGVGRLMASVLEKKGTRDAVNWPVSIAPFDIHICPIDYTKNEIVKEKTDEIYNELLKIGYDVLLDDRNKSAGVKFKDSDLIGASIRIVVSPRNLDNDLLEVKISGQSQATLVKKDELISYIQEKFELLLKEVE